MNNTHLTKTRFSNLELSDSILHGLTDAGFSYCTPIQDRTLPLSLRGKDIAGQAQTGTGKTAAFLLATFQHLINDSDDIDAEDKESPETVTDNSGDTTVSIREPGQRRERLSGAVAGNKRINSPRAIILAPTRELAIQIHKDAVLLSKYLDLKSVLVYGGTDYQKQLDKVKSNVDIIIGTPGRIIDFYKQQAFLWTMCKSPSWMKPTGCLTWALSKTYATCSGACQHRNCA